MNKTPEDEQSEVNNTPMPLAPAGFWLRAFAHLIDAITIYLLYVLLIAVLPGLPVVIALLLGFLSIFISLVYMVSFEASTLRATPGKVVMGLYVVGPDNSEPATIKILIRNLSRILCALTFGLGYVMAGLTVGKQGLHDMVASTYVVRRPGVPDAQRVFGAVFAVLFSIGITLLLPAEMTQRKKAPADSELISLDSNEIDDLPALLPAVDSNFIPFPSDSIGYLQHEQEKIDFADVFIRLEEVEDTDLGAGSRIARRTVVAKFAFFETELTESDESQLRRSINFFDDTKRLIGKEAVAVLSLAFPSYMQVCQTSHIESGYLDINIKDLPQISSEDRRTLRTPVDALELFSKNKFFSDCNDLAAGGTFELAIQQVAQPALDYPPILLNVRLTDVMFKRQIQSTAQYIGGQDAFAFYTQSSGELQVGIFAQELGREDKKTKYNQRSLTAGSIQPTVLIIYEIAATSQRFMQDQVSSYRVRFFRQPSGPLAFPGDSSTFEKTYTSDLPTLLTGRIKTGERLVGKIIGSHDVIAGQERYPIRWAVPFNAHLIVVD